MNVIRILLCFLIAPSCLSLLKAEAFSLIWKWNDCHGVNISQYEVFEKINSDGAHQIVLHVKYTGFIRENDVEMLSKNLDIEKDYIVTVRRASDGTALVTIDGFTGVMRGVNNLYIHTPLQKVSNKPPLVEIYFVTINPNIYGEITVGIETTVEQLEQLKQEGKLQYFPVYSKLIDNIDT